MRDDGTTLRMMALAVRSPRAELPPEPCDELPPPVIAPSFPFILAPILPIFPCIFPPGLFPMVAN
jgi:hypothetical protein